MKKQSYLPLHMVERMDELEGMMGDIPADIKSNIEKDSHIYMDYAIGPKFMKSNYDGPHKELNDLLLKRYRNGEMKVLGDGYNEIRTEVRDLYAIPAMLQIWDRHRQAYVFDPDFAEELIQTKGVRIPLSLFHGMPYPCYYLDTRNLPWFRPFVGCFLYVTPDPESGIPNICMIRVTDPPEGKEDPVCYTAYFDSRCIGKQMLDVDRDENGEPILTPDHIYVCMDDEYQIANTYRKTWVEGDMSLTLTDGFNETYAREFFLFVLQTVSYLSSYKPDVVPSRTYARKPKPKRDGDPERTRPELTVSDVGIRYGTAIRVRKQAMKRQAKGTRSPEPSGRPRKPMASHIRRAHWHRYRTGKGRTQLILKWIPPVFVCGGRELPVTIHEIK